MARATLVNPNSIIQDGIEYYFQTDKSVYDLGENVEILYRVTNVTENPIYIGMVLNCEYGWCNFIITDDDNTDIWQHLRVIPPCGFRRFHLPPHGSKEYQRSWDMISDNGTFGDYDDDYPVGPGLYNIMGELRLDGGYERVPVSVSIEIIPEPVTLLLFGLGGLFVRKRN